jgi:hypothetical protein
LKETGMRNADEPALEGEILGNEIPDPEAREVTPGWITRHKDLILKGRMAARALTVAAPPPARLVFAALSVAADGLLLAEDARRGLVDRKAAGARAGGLVLEGAAVFAATRYAPAILARHRAKLAAARSALHRLDPFPATGATR